MQEFTIMILALKELLLAGNLPEASLSWMEAVSHWLTLQPRVIILYLLLKQSPVKVYLTLALAGHACNTEFTGAALAVDKVITSIWGRFI